MEEIKKLIIALEHCIPGLDTAPLLANPPLSIEQGTVLDWLYEHLGEQNLMEYEEWSEYSGYLPELKPLSTLILPEDPAEFVFSLIEEIDWPTSNVDPYELPYVMPWFEHINFYLKPHGVKLVDLLPFENAYILCIRDDETALQDLQSSLQAFSMDINERDAMDRQQITAYIESLVSG